MFPYYICRFSYQYYIIVIIFDRRWLVDVLGSGLFEHARVLSWNIRQVCYGGNRQSREGGMKPTSTFQFQTASLPYKLRKNR